MENYRQRITIEPGKRGGKPCIRHMRITVYDVRTSVTPHAPEVNWISNETAGIRLPELHENL